MSAGTTEKQAPEELGRRAGRTRGPGRGPPAEHFNTGPSFQHAALFWLLCLNFRFT